MIKLVSVVNTLRISDGGPARNAYELTQALNSTGELHTTLTVVRAGAGRLPFSESSDRPSNGPMRILQNIRRLSARIKTSDVVLIHGYFLWWIPFVCYWAQAHNKPILLVPHGSLTKHHRKKSPVKKQFWELTAGRFVRRTLQAFMVASEIESTELLEVFPLSKTHVTGIGTELPPPPASQGRTMPVPSDTIRLLSVARIAPKKRIDLMIDALHELSRRGVKAQLVIAGDGPAEDVERLENQARKLGLTEWVKFVGMLAGADKTAAYSSSDIFLAPSDDENFGMSVAEALAHGLPCIVSSNVASAAQLPRTAGIVLDRPTASNIASAITDLMTDNVADMRAAAAEYARLQFDWHSIAANWGSYLRRIRGA